jgi:hypothetical protein
MAQIELQKADSGTIREVFWFRQNRKSVILLGQLARMFHELPSRDCEDERATGQPQGVGSEAYLKSTSQGPTSEDARKGVHIRGLSRLLMKHPG